MYLVRAAVEFTIRTGRDGLEMSPHQLLFAVKVLRDADRTGLQLAAVSTAAGMGSKEAAEAVFE